MHSPALVRSSAVPARTSQAGLFDTFALFADVILPTLAKGVIMRRPAVLALAEHFEIDRRAIRRMQRLRAKYGSGPLMVRVLGRNIAVIMHSDDVHRVLIESPEPFTPSTLEKRAALAHFEPKNVLISQGAERLERRRFNEEALDSDRPVHHMAQAFIDVVNAEVARLRSRLRGGEMNWNQFSDAWFRIVRRVIFGAAAVNDHELSSIIARLRSHANWAFLFPQNSGLRAELLGRIRMYLQRAEPDSLAGHIATLRVTRGMAPEQQIPQWLFAFDPAGMTTFRALALLACQPKYAGIARQELATRRGESRHYVPFLRATVLESLRLWPTTPMVLRETTTPTEWRNGEMPAHTAILIYSPFFHRDDEQLDYADRFSPGLWTNDRPAPSWPLIPFSEGPATCPGRNLVLVLTTAMIAALMEHNDLRLKSGPNLDADGRLPATLNHFALRFRL